MDYQYKSIIRGENSIFGQIAAQGVDPKSEFESSWDHQNTYDGQITFSFSTFDHSIV